MKYYSLGGACKKVITDLAQAYGVKSAIDIFIEDDEDHLSGGFTGTNVETGNIAVCINIGRSRTNMEMIHQCRHEFRHVWQLYFNRDLTEWWRDWQTEAQEKCDGRDMLAAAQYTFSAIELDAERFAFSGKDDVCLLRELLPASKEESVQQILLRNVSWVLAHPEDFQGRIRRAAEEYMDRLK